MINVLQTAIDMPWGQVIVKSLSSQTLDVNDYIYCAGQQSIVQIQAKYEKYENHEQPAGYMPFTDNNGRTWWATRNELCKAIEEELRRKLPSVEGAIASMFKDCRFPMDEPENEAVQRSVMSDQDLINNWFTYHPPTAAQHVDYSLINSFAAELANRIMVCCPESVERLEALNRLRECRMWANAAIACNSGSK